MKKKLIKRAIFFMISCNMVVFTPTWASQETKKYNNFIKYRSI